MRARRVGEGLSRSQFRSFFLSLWGSGSRSWPPPNLNVLASLGSFGPSLGGFGPCDGAPAPRHNSMIVPCSHGITILAGQISGTRPQFAQFEKNVVWDETMCSQDFFHCSRKKWPESNMAWVLVKVDDTSHTLPNPSLLHTPASLFSHNSLRVCASIPHFLHSLLIAFLLFSLISLSILVSVATLLYHFPHCPTVTFPHRVTFF